MSKIDDALQTIQTMENPMERALNIAALLSTVFKIRGVILGLAGNLAYGAYVNAALEHPEVDFTLITGKLTPRLLQEIMVSQIGAEGMLERWLVADVLVHFGGPLETPNPQLLRDFPNDYGVIKLVPPEDLIAERLVAATFPVPNAFAREEALNLIKGGLKEEYMVDWALLQKLCGHSDYRVTEVLSELRQEAKKSLDQEGLLYDQVGEIQPVPSSGE